MTQHPLAPRTKRCRECGSDRRPSAFHRSQSVCKDCAKIRRAARYWADRERELARNAAWVAAHPERRQRSRLAWRQANKARYRTYALVRRQRIRSAGGTISPEEWRKLKERYGYRCLCCGRTGLELVADHVVPIAKGGKNDISNLQPLCRLDNLRKGVKTIDYRQDWEDVDGFSGLSGRNAPPPGGAAPHARGGALGGGGPLRRGGGERAARCRPAGVRL